jgi:hypothetical protein
MDNLDRLAAQTAQSIIKKTQQQAGNLITKTLGVLQKNGVYAATLFLLSRTSNEKEIAEKSVLPELVNILSSTKLSSFNLKYEGKGNFDNAKDRSAAEALLRHISDRVCNDLDTLLLVKQVWEQTLIYARYGAKAARKEGN